jgi:hypothetical protein
MVDGAMSGGSPLAQSAAKVNLFDPGRVLLRPPAFMALPVLNENGHLAVPVSGEATEFGAFIGSKDYQLAQLADFNATHLNVTYTHSGADTCMEAAALSFSSPDFARLAHPPVKVLDEFGSQAGLKGRLNVALNANTLSVWLPGFCVPGPASRVTAVFRLLTV